MENHHFQWENPLFQWAIFHCYVKLPEGKPPFSYGFPMVFPLKPPFLELQKALAQSSEPCQRASSAPPRWRAPPTPYGSTTGRRSTRGKATAVTLWLCQNSY